MAKQYINNDAVLHVRYNGRSMDVPLGSLELRAGADDDQIKNRIAGYLEVSPRNLGDYVIDRHANGNLTLRPEAVFG